MSPTAAASRRRSMTTAERRHQIIESAAKLFDAHGYGNASMEDVAASVSIAKATLYHYFPSKEEILRSIHEEFIQLLIDKYMQRVTSGLEPEELVLGAMKDILSLMVTHRGYVRVFFEHHRGCGQIARILGIRRKLGDYVGWEFVARDRRSFRLIEATRHRYTVVLLTRSGDSQSFGQHARSGGLLRNFAGLDFGLTGIEADLPGRRKRFDGFRGAEQERCGGGFGAQAIAGEQ